ncbi:MAG: YhgN family NAAT transporter [Oligoflexales bacterium]|nr:YhgN family NAAT transporter [Oligoflexales bacterium]
MMSIFSAAMTLFLIMDPLGNIPIFASILKDIEPRRQRRIIVREHLISLGILLGVLLIGEHVTQFLGLRQESISIGGGIVLFLIAVRMIFPSAAGNAGDELEGEPLIVPLAIPLISGPSAIATLLLFVSSYPNSLLEWCAAVFLAWSGSLTIHFFSNRFIQVLSRRVLIAIERLMGMVLVVMAVQMFFDGILKYFGFP